VKWGVKECEVKYQIDNADKQAPIRLTSILPRRGTQNGAEFSEEGSIEVTIRTGESCQEFGSAVFDK